MRSSENYRIGSWREYLDSLGGPDGSLVLDIPPLDPLHTALVLVDIQRKMVDPSVPSMLPPGPSDSNGQGGGTANLTPMQARIKDLVVPNVRRLLDEFRSRGLHVLHFAAGPQYPKGEDLPLSYRLLLMPGIKAFGSTVHWEDPRYDFPDYLQPLEHEFVIRKRTRSGFLHTEAERLLRGMGVTDLVVVGGATEACVESTVRDAADCGFKVIAVEDAVIPASPLNQDATMITIARFFGAVRTTEEVLAEMRTQDAPVEAATSGGA